MAGNTVEVFFSYSHKDEALRDQLATHLKLLERQGIITAWHDRKIVAGSEWAGDIHNSLAQADIILLLVSADFLASDYCWDVEIAKALERHEAGETIVIPVILRPVDWSSASFAKLQALPKNAQPVVTWNPPDLAFMDIAKGIRLKAETLVATRQQRAALAQKQQALTAYQQRLKTYLAAGTLTFIVRENLNDLAQTLGLTQSDIAAVEAEETAAHTAYQANLERYGQTYRQALDYETPLSDSTQAHLRDRQNILHLRATDVQQLEQQIYADWQQQQQAQAESDRLRQQQEEAEQLRQQQATAQRQEQERQQQAAALAEYQKRETAEQLHKVQAEQERIRQQQAEAERQPLPPSRSTFEFDVVTFSVEKGLLGLGQPKITTNRRRSKAEYFCEALSNGITLDVAKIPAGRFSMGAPQSEESRSNDEGPPHTVTVSEFWMGKYPVTQAQYQAVMGKNPSEFSENGANRPVESVSWHDAVAFCEKLSQQTGRTYRLPSEAEWEYACRAGTTTPFYFGPAITPDLANYDGNYTYGNGPKGVYREQTTEVGSFPANAFGLYDMHGNVWEWCGDHWHSNYEGAPTDGTAWLSSDELAFRLLRGGSWGSSPRYCRSAFRNYDHPDLRYSSLGFRVVVSAARAL